MLTDSLLMITGGESGDKETNLESASVLRHNCCCSQQRLVNVLPPSAQISNSSCDTAVIQTHVCHILLYRTFYKLNTTYICCIWLKVTDWIVKHVSYSLLLPGRTETCTVTSEAHRCDVIVIVIVDCLNKTDLIWYRVMFWFAFTKRTVGICCKETECVAAFRASSQQPCESFKRQR